MSWTVHIKKNYSAHLERVELSQHGLPFLPKQGDKIEWEDGQGNVQYETIKYVEFSFLVKTIYIVTEGGHSSA